MWDAKKSQLSFGHAWGGEVDTQDQDCCCMGALCRHSALLMDEDRLQLPFPKNAVPWEMELGWQGRAHRGTLLLC